MKKAKVTDMLIAIGVAIGTTALLVLKYNVPFPISVLLSISTFIVWRKIT